MKNLTSIAVAIIIFILAAIYVVYNNQPINTGLFTALMLGVLTWMMLKVGMSNER